MDIRRFGNIVFIPGSAGARYPHCNSLFIDDEVKVLIDPGSDEAFLKDIALNQHVDVLLDTHYHEDHTAFNHLFPDAALWVHEAEAPCHRSYQTFLEYYGLQETPYRKEWDEFLLGKFHYRERIPARELKDGDILVFGRTRARVVYTPGHTIGHICLHFPDEGILFLADYDLTPFGPWYGDYCSDIGQTIESVKRLLKIPADLYITGHQLGIVREGFEELAGAYLDVIGQREAKLLDFLASPRTLDEIVERWMIYGRERKPRYFFELGEREMMRKHLQRLIASGQAVKRDNRYSRPCSREEKARKPRPAAKGVPQAHSIERYRVLPESVTYPHFSFLALLRPCVLKSRIDNRNSIDGLKSTDGKVVILAPGTSEAASGGINRAGATHIFLQV